MRFLPLTPSPLPARGERGTWRAVVALAVMALLACDVPAPVPAPPEDAGAGEADAGALDAGLPDAGVALDAGPDFLVPELLGRPADTSVVVNVVPARTLEVLVEAGPVGAERVVVPARVLAAGQPVALVLGGLPPGAACAYRLQWREPGTSALNVGPWRAFRTQATPDASFTFTVQADSHMDENSLAEQYARTLDNIRLDAPDFHVDLGDTFMCEKHSEPLVTQVLPAADEATVLRRYAWERGNFGRLEGAVPLLLVNGNHDGELGSFLRGTGDDLATWTTRARQRYFPVPVPGDIYTGDVRVLPFVGQRGAFYAFTWGPALFVMLDPFWDTTQRLSMSGWSITLGPAQYAWLAATLRASPARFKFVFLHNLVGGLDGQQRGGVEAAPWFEWGGRELDGGYTFPQRRAGWEKPIHPLLVETRVTAVFHGHDHLYAHQVLDGIVYQEVPQPSTRNTMSGSILAAEYHYDAGTILSSAGHLRVAVTPAEVRCEYVRSWVPAQENGSRHNRETAHAWRVAAP